MYLDELRAQQQQADADDAYLRHVVEQREQEAAAPEDDEVPGPRKLVFRPLD